MGTSSVKCIKDLCYFLKCLSIIISMKFSIKKFWAQGIAQQKAALASVKPWVQYSVQREK